MAHILALVVGLGSVGLYMAAFFFPEVYRKNDFVLSGIGMFYALVLWVCAGRMTGGVLLGQAASVTLLGWLAWQSLEMRRSLTPIDQQTRLPGSARTLADVVRKSAKDLPGQLQQQAKRLSLPAALGGLSQRATRAIGTTPQRAPKQLQDGDRVRQPLVKQPNASGDSVSPVKPTKSTKSTKSTRSENLDRPAKKRPAKLSEPSAPVDQPTTDSTATSPIAPPPITIPPEPAPPIAPEPPAAPQPPEAIVPPAVDDLTLAELPVAPEAIAPDTLGESSPEAGLDAEPISASTPASDPESLVAPVAPPASDDDFGFDDEITPTRASAAELRELTAQSAASRRPSWFTTLKRRLQRGRNPEPRSPQVGSPPAQQVPTVETAPDAALETVEVALAANALQEPLQAPVDTAPLPAPQETPELSAPDEAPAEPDAAPANSAPLTAVSEEISEAIAPPLAAESLTPNAEEDWDLGWMETSVPSEVVPAPPAVDREDADFEDAEFLGADTSVTITVEAETVSALEADPAPDSFTDTEWDLDWAQEVVAAESAAEVVAELLAEAPLDASPELLPEPSLETLSDSLPASVAASLPDPATVLPDSSPEFAVVVEADLTVEPEPGLDSSSGLDAAAIEAEWDDWEAPVTDEFAEEAAPADEWEELVEESPVFLPLLLEEVDADAEADPIASESNWPEAESNWPEPESATIAPSPDWAEPPEEEPDAIAFPSEDFSELLNTTEPAGGEDSAAAVALDQPAAIAPLSDFSESLPDSDESLGNANAPLSLTYESLSVIDEPSSVADESLSVIDESLSVADESLSVIDESLSPIDESPIVIDESLSVADESLSVADDFPIVIDESPIVIDEFLTVADEYLSVADDFPIVIDESLSVADESLSVADESLSVSDASQGQEFELLDPDPESETTFVENTDSLAATDREPSDDAAVEVAVDAVPEAVLEMPSDLPSEASDNLPATPPTRSAERRLIIQVVKIEPSEAASEPLPAAEEPPSHE